MSNDTGGNRPPQSDGSFAQMLQDSLGGGGNVPIGEKINATIFNIGKDYVFLDLGGREEGLLQRTEVEEDGELTVKVGDTIAVFTIKVRDGAFICGLRVGAAGMSESPGDSEMALMTLREAYDSGMPVEGSVKEVIKGGFSITVMGLRAFCPISQIADSYTENPEEHLGHTYGFAVIELDGSGRNIVVSRRKLLEAEAQELAATLWDRIEEGAVYNGEVKSVKSYGAFVDIGGIQGLLHVSEIDYDRVEDPHDAFKIGDKVRVIIKSIDREQQRVALSRKALLDDPWIEAEQTIKEDAVLKGIVVRLAQFGAFVELRKGIEGLVHISEMGGGKHLRSPREVVKLDDEITVKVLNFDAENHKISLSMDDVERDAERGETVSALAHQREARRVGPGLGTFADLFGDKLKK